MKDMNRLRTRERKPPEFFDGLLSEEIIASRQTSSSVDGSQNQEIK